MRRRAEQVHFQKVVSFQFTLLALRLQQQSQVWRLSNLMQIIYRNATCRATIAEIRQHKWVAQDYEPCMSLQRISSTEVPEYVFEEANVQPQYISQVRSQHHVLLCTALFLVVILMRLCVCV